MKDKNIIKISNKTDTTDEKYIEIECFGKKQKALLLNPYGITSNPKDDNLAVIMQQDGHEDSLMAIVIDAKNRDTLEKGEVSFGIPSKKTRIFFNVDDEIIIFNDDNEIKLDKNGKLTATINSTFKIEDGNGNVIESTTTSVKINGNLEVLQ